MKLLVLDTCALIKLFVWEQGSHTMRWLIHNHVKYCLNISMSVIARLEFESVLWKKTAHGQLTIPQTRGILRRARGYFNGIIHVRDTSPPPAFTTSSPLEYGKLLKKHALKAGINDRDVWHVMCAHNYLRCFGGESLPYIVTSDPGLKEIILVEGYRVIDPVIHTPEHLCNMWDSSRADKA